MTESQKKQLIIKLNIDKILSENPNHAYSSQIINERKINKFLAADTILDEDKLDILVESFIQEFHTNKSTLLDDTLYKLIHKYNHSFKNIEKYHKETSLLIKGGAETLIEQLGDNSVDNIVKSVLKGGNVRDITELITRTKLSISNAALLDLFSSFDFSKNDSLDNFFLYTKSNISLSTISSQNTLLSLWLLGLTQKSLNNIVRGRQNLNDYTNNLFDTLTDTIDNIEHTFGELSGDIKIGDKSLIINWTTFITLSMAIGAQTLSIRGSDKSTNGKFFEKLILGSSLSIMGFSYCETLPEIINKNDKFFILSSTETNERETDATIICNDKAVSVDIGFIGGGNPEITADKLTRFRSDKNIGLKNINMVPLVIVDTINNDTVIKTLASSLNGKAIEMKDKYWITHMASFLSGFFETNCFFENITDLEELHDKIDIDVSQLDLSIFI